MLRYFVREGVLNVDVYGRQGLEEVKTIIPRMISDEHSVIQEVVVKVHFARPEDLNGGDKIMSCMFAHSLTRLIAIITKDEDQVEYVNRESPMLTRHGVQARAFRTITDSVDWIEQEFPIDALACAM